MEQFVLTIGKMSYTCKIVKNSAETFTLIQSQHGSFTVQIEIRDQQLSTKAQQLVFVEALHEALEIAKKTQGVRIQN